MGKTSKIDSVLQFQWILADRPVHPLATQLPDLSLSSDPAMPAYLYQFSRDSCFPTQPPPKPSSQCTASWENSPIQHGRATLPRAHSFCDVGLVYLCALPLFDRAEVACPSQDSRLLCALQRPLDYCCVSALVLDVGIRKGLCLQRTHSSFAGTWTVATLVQGTLSWKSVLSRTVKGMGGRRRGWGQLRVGGESLQVWQWSRPAGGHQTLTSGRC